MIYTYMYTIRFDRIYMILDHIYIHNNYNNVESHLLYIYIMMFNLLYMILMLFSTVIRGARARYLPETLTLNSNQQNFSNNRSMGCAPLKLRLARCLQAGLCLLRG